MRGWRPHTGMRPSPNEARVLLHVVREWAMSHTHYGAGVTGLHRACQSDGWSPGLSTVRHHLTNLQAKGLVHKTDRRAFTRGSRKLASTPGAGLISYEPTTQGHLYVLECAKPFLSKCARNHPHIPGL